MGLPLAVDWCILAIAAFGATWLKGPAFPHSNNVFHIPIALGYASSVEGPHDAFHQSLTHFASFFWLAVAKIASEENIESVFLTLHFITVLATLVGAYMLAKGAGVPRKLAILACSLFAFDFISRPELEFGGGEVLAGYLTHSQLATAVCLFSLALASRQRWRWAAVACGLAADINLFLGFWLIINLLLARVMIEWRPSLRQTLRILWKDALFMGAACLLLALPAIIWVLSDMGQSTMPAFSFEAYLYSYYPYHSFLHLQIGFFLAFAALCVGVWIAQASERMTREPLTVLFVSGIVTVLLGSLLPYLTDARLIHDLYPLRYAAIVQWLAALAVIRLWARVESHAADPAHADQLHVDQPTVDQQGTRAGFAAVAVLGFMLSMPGVTLLAMMFLVNWQQLRTALRWVLLACAWAGLVGMNIPLAETAAGSFPLPTQAAALVIYLGPIPTLLLVCGGSALVLSIRSALSDRWLHIALVWLMASATLIPDRTATVLAATIIVLSAGAVLWNIRFKALVVVFACGLMAGYMISQGAAVHALVPLAIACLLLGALQLVASNPRMADFPATDMRLSLAGCLVMALCVLGVLKAVRNEFRAPRTDYDENLFAAEQWARAHTPPGSLFYEPEDNGFAMFSRRPVWWSSKQGAAVMWEPDFYAQWEQRRSRASRVKSLSDLIVLAREEHIQYLVLERRKLHGDAENQGLEFKYCNDTFCIAEPRSTAAGAPFESR